MQQPIRIFSKATKKVYTDAIPGHFATNHSHINYYLDMSTVKHNQAMAREAARVIAYHFQGISIDTILCLEGTEYIGAFVSLELTRDSLSSFNSGKDLYLVEPDNNTNGQFVFADNIRYMIEGRNVLILVTSASTGQTLAQTKECVEYYGGRVAGYSALFSNLSELEGLPVVRLFSSEDLPHYRNYPHGKGCPDCAAGRPIDAIALPNGYIKL